MEAIEQAAKAYQEAMRKVDNNSSYDSIDVDAIRYVAFRAGAGWQKEQSYTKDQIRQAILEYCDENGMDDDEAKECVEDFINNFLIKK